MMKNSIILVIKGGRHMAKTNRTKKLSLNTSSILKLFTLFCIVIHMMIAIFSIYTKITPLLVLNLCSILLYIYCIYIVAKHPAKVFYIGFGEIVLHSFISVVLVGNGFGFSMYFIALVPMAFNLLHAAKSNKYILKSFILSIISFVLFAGCYIISNLHTPLYESDILSNLKPYIYIVNMFITFVALLGFSILFLIEIESAYNSLYNKNLELDNLANTDPLTGLYNRRTMTVHVQNMYEDYHKTQKPFSLIVCDIDNFKKFNDTYGHECGDEVLKTISSVLSSLTRGHDFLCRWGGEEFIVFLRNIDREMALNIAERIRQKIEETEIKFEDKNLHITMTFGVSSATETDDYEELFKLADSRMYEGKRSGKNKVV